MAGFSFQNWIKSWGTKEEKPAADPKETRGPAEEYVNGHPVLTCPTDTSPGSPIINGLLKPLGLVDCKKPGTPEKAKGEAPKKLAPIESREKSRAEIDVEAARWEALREADRAIKKAQESSKAAPPVSAPAADAPVAPAAITPEPAKTFPVRPPGPIETRPAADTPVTDAGTYTPIKGRFSADIYKRVTEKAGATPALQEIFATAVRDEHYDARVARMSPITPASERVATAAPAPASVF